MSDWLDDFQMFGASLSEGEKTLMRFAMKKERERFARIAKIQLDEQTADELIYLVNDVNVL